MGIKKLKAKVEKLKEQLVFLQAQNEAHENARCDDILSLAEKSDLTLEVIYSAFRFKDNNPGASLLECLEEGAAEWDI